VNALEFAMVVFNVVLASVCLSALLWGGAPERWGVVINLLGALVSAIVRKAHGHHWMQFEAGTCVIDIMVLWAFLILAQRSTRFWPVWAAGFALADISVHLARLTMPGIGFLAYGNAEVGCTYLALLVLAIGVAGHRQDRRAGRPGQPWRTAPI
jgi:hypothetical protein